MSRRPRRVGLVMIVTAFTLASCGGDDGSAEEETQLRADVTEALTTKDPIACTRFATQRFVEQLSGLRGKSALRSCREDADETDTESVAFDRVAISGPRASVTVRPHGADDGLKTLDFKLRKSEGRWKLDRLSGGALVRGEFLRLTRKELRAPPDALSAKAADCVVRDLERRDDDDLVRGIMSGDPSQLVVPVTTCVTLSDLSDKPEDRGFVHCIERRLRRELTEGAIGRRIAARKAGVEVLESKAFERAADGIVAGCARDHGMTAAA